MVGEIMKKRAVITGIGCVTPIGIGKERFWNSLINGMSGIDYITRFDTGGFGVKICY
jgi:3-oxoacyl-[acyl-carrier-protein] synthase II